VDHMILSHHGHLEFGSPKLPQFPEALLLHYIDDMDSKMECMRALIENDRQVEGCFTTYNGALERAALKKDRYLNPETQAEAERPAPETRAAINGSGPQPQTALGEKPETAARPSNASGPASPFADKLKHALGPAGPEPER